LKFEEIRTLLATTQSGIYELEQDLAELKINWFDDEKQLQLDVIEAFDLLQNSIDNWKLSCQLISPIEGVVSFNKVWAVNQNVTSGDVVMAIVPVRPEGILGKAYVPVRGAGKVKPGQRVNIKLSNYPYMEYGMLIGRVKSKAPVPVKDFYAVEIELPDELTTNYGRSLEMQQELRGGEIITDDLRLIQRIVYPIKAALQRNRR
jgi:HlyD family secretion protein